MVVKFRHDYLVTLGKPATQAACQMERQRRHVLPEHDLVRRRIEKIRERLPRLFDQPIRLVARRVAPVRVGVVVEEVIVHRLHHGSRHLRSTGTVEIRYGMPIVRACQSGKL